MDKKYYEKMLLIMVPLSIVILLFCLLVNPIIRVWIGEGIVASKMLIFLLALYTIVNIWSNIFAYLLNGINKVNGQLITVGLGALLNIPLSIFFARDLGLGSIGIVLGTIVCLIPFAIIGPILSYSELKKAQGLLNN
ncbi:hypothetical protein GTW56_13950 [Bacillus sp. EB93]|nr:hypothetical protein [Peribacillus frigoritolerans]